MDVHWGANVLGHLDAPIRPLIERQVCPQSGHWIDVQRMAAPSPFCPMLRSVRTEAMRGNPVKTIALT